ncbi:hypothetical protein AKJ09_09957 [Labilithrix luteola]|uniref:Phospholipid-binding protein n=1 Tax=Labilithrix luteola TaxID=1391654 RepID=A0A0K1QC21_9BACT|nr:YbhB/YbcL family Raf kinase inhibitor-like protein [Labilithrix luteola]AKV03294.1 hypothetical protein AKJ09_09957 [Labilithrix luteola]
MATKKLEVSSTAFGEGKTIPKRYTADGENVSPPLKWSEPPDDTQSFAIVCDDPDAPSGTFVHWTAWNIKADERELQEALPHLADQADLRQGANSFGRPGYGGPKPPPGKPHHYRFHVYALDIRPDVDPGISPAELERALRGHILAEGRLTGLYGR